MKYPTKKRTRRTSKKTIRGGNPNNKRPRNNNNNNNNRPSKKLRINNIPSNYDDIPLETQWLHLLGNNNQNNQNNQNNNKQSKSPNQIFLSEENAKKYRQKMRNTEPPHTLMFNTAIEPKFIAKGVHGCGFKPAIPCSEPCNDLKCKDYNPRVSKLMTKEVADREMSIYTELGLNEIPDADTYFIVNPYQCTPSPTFNYKEKGCLINIKEPSTLIYEDGGIDLYQHIKKDNGYNFLSVLKGLKNIFKGVEKLYTHHIYHFDIKEDNIVMGQEKNQFRLIDFGNARKYKEEKPIFLRNVRLDHILRKPEETQATTLLTPQRPQRTEEFATPQRLSKTNSLSPKSPIQIEVKEPVIVRIFPIYQFFITEAFSVRKEDFSFNRLLGAVGLGSKIVNPPDEDYELLSNKFIDTFMTINDPIINLVRHYYNMIGGFDKESIKEIFDNLKKLDPTQRTVLILRKIDLYSIGLLIFKLAYYKNRDITIDDPVIQFLKESRLLHPNPNPTNPDEIITFSDIMTKYDKLIEKLNIK